MTNPGDYSIKKDLAFPQVRKDSFLFHNHAFVERNQPVNMVGYGLYENDELIAKIHFQIVENVAISLPKSPFGSFDSTSNITTEPVKELAHYFIDDLASHDVEKIIIDGFPTIYRPQNAKVVESALLVVGFKKFINNITQFLQTGQDFRTHIKPSQRRYLNFSHANKFTFRTLKINELNKAYELIKASREVKNYPVTMSLEQLRETILKFNKAYHLFGLFNDKTMIASAVCIAVNNHILYDFYHGDNIDYRKHSPVVPLISNLVDFARERGFSILDLGVSTENEIINKGLFDFKKNLGALTSQKPSYQLDL